MTEPEVITYLTDENSDGMTEVDRHLTIIDVATNYGLELDRDDDLLITMLTWQQTNGHRPYLDNQYVTSLDSALDRITTMSIDFLHDNDVVPYAYDHGETDPYAGYGDSTARGDAARETDGAEGWQE